MPKTANTKPRCAVFYTGRGFAICLLATDQELDLGPYECAHDAWLAAHELGMHVVDLWGTRRSAKPRPRKPIEETAQETAT